MPSVNSEGKLWGVFLVPSRELFWAVYACIHALEQSRHDDGDASFKRLAKEWQTWLDYVKTTAAQVFYRGNGRICAVTKIKDQTLPLADPQQSYACESADYLDDPYEGELFAYFLHAFGGLDRREKRALWQAKRAKLVKVEYNEGGIGPITVEQGMHDPLSPCLSTRKRM